MTSRYTDGSPPPVGPVHPDRVTGPLPPNPYLEEAWMRIYPASTTHGRSGAPFFLKNRPGETLSLELPRREDSSMFMRFTCTCFVGVLLDTDDMVLAIPSRDWYDRDIVIKAIGEHLESPTDILILPSSRAYQRTTTSVVPRSFLSVHIMEQTLRPLWKTLGHPVFTERGRKIAASIREGDVPVTVILRPASDGFTLVMVHLSRRARHEHNGTDQHNAAREGGGAPGEVLDHPGPGSLHPQGEPPR